MNKIISLFNLTYLRLTAFYILIVMTISISFSIALFNISTAEISRGLGQQLRSKILYNTTVTEYEEFRLNQLSESKKHLVANLIYFNLLILIVTGILGYFIARKNMEPFEEVIESQSRFIADASHELKTPLTAIRTETEVALRQNLTIQKAKQILASNLEETKKLQNLAESLLDLARIESSAFFVQTHKISEIIISAYEGVEKSAKMKNIRFDIKNIDKAGVSGDRGRLIQMFAILFDNAIKFSKENSKVIVTAKKKGTKTITQVIDSGSGIKQSQLPHIFDRFYQGNISRTKNQDRTGFGLGLSIAKEIVKIHGGKIFVESKEGEGTKFTITL